MIRLNGRSHGLKLLLVPIGMFYSIPAIATPYTCYFGKGDRTVISSPFETLAGEVKQVSYFRTNVQDIWSDLLRDNYGISEIHNYYGCHKTDQERWAKDRAEAKARGQKEEIIKFNPFGHAEIEWADISDSDGSDKEKAKPVHQVDRGYLDIKVRQPADAPGAEAKQAEKVRLQKEAAAKVEAAEQARVAQLNQEIADANKKLADENARKLADYEAKMTAYQESLARAAAAKKAYEEKLAENAREVQAHRAAMNTYNKEVGNGQTKGGVEVVSQLTGPYRKTREEALATLMSVSKSYPDVFDIKCERMAGNYFEEPWACWGSYREIKTRSSVSKQ